MALAPRVMPALWRAARLVTTTAPAAAPATPSPPPPPPRPPPTNPFQTTLKHVPQRLQEAQLSEGQAAVLCEEMQRLMERNAGQLQREFMSTAEKQRLEALVKSTVEAATSELIQVKIKLEAALQRSQEDLGTLKTQQATETTKKRKEEEAAMQKLAANVAEVSARIHATTGELKLKVHRVDDAFHQGSLEAFRPLVARLYNAWRSVLRDATLMPPLHARLKSHGPWASPEPAPHAPGAAGGTPAAAPRPPPPGSPSGAVPKPSAPGGPATAAAAAAAPVTPSPASPASPAAPAAKADASASAGHAASRSAAPPGTHATPPDPTGAAATAKTHASTPPPAAEAPLSPALGGAMAALPAFLERGLARLRGRAAPRQPPPGEGYPVMGPAAPPSDDKNEPGPN